MTQAEYTITRHRNGYYEIRNCQGSLLQTADNMKEAETDLNKIKNEDEFAKTLVSI